MILSISSSLFSFFFSSNLRNKFESSKHSTLESIQSHLQQIELWTKSDNNEVQTEYLKILSLYLRKYFQFCVQDCSATLTTLFDEIKSTIDSFKESNTLLMTHPYQEEILNIFKQYETLDSIKENARRIPYGYRSPNELKEISLYEDQSIFALWRWEVVLLSEDFPYNEDIKNVKTDFTRVGRAIKAIFQVIVKLTKFLPLGDGNIPNEEEIKINALEDKVTASLAEIQKAHEKKVALEKKRLLAEAETEKKLKRKLELSTSSKNSLEEEKTKKKISEEVSNNSSNSDNNTTNSSTLQVDTNQDKSEEVPQKKKLKPLGEKEKKEQAVMEKQKSLLLNFLTPTSKSKTSSQNNVSSSNDNHKNNSMISPTSARFDTLNDYSTPDKLLTSLPSTTLEVSDNANFLNNINQNHCSKIDIELFEKYLLNPISLSEIILQNSKRLFLNTFKFFFLLLLILL